VLLAQDDDVVVREQADHIIDRALTVLHKPAFEFGPEFGIERRRLDPSLSFDLRLSTCDDPTYE
jgi:hypothetical protein